MQHPNRLLRRIAVIVAVAVMVCSVAKSLAAETNTQMSVTATVIRSPIVARVNGVGISERLLLREIRRSSQIDTPQVREALIKRLVDREVIRQTAQAKGYETRTEVTDAIRDAKTEAMTDLFLHETYRPQVITEAQIKEHYKQYVKDLSAKEYKASIIVVAEEAEAKQAMVLLGSGESFAAVAKHMSGAFNAHMGGEMEWASFGTKEGHTNGLPLPVADALMRMPAGSMVPKPIMAGNLFWIVKLDDVRSKTAPSYESIRTQLCKKLEAEAHDRAIEALVHDLKKSAHIQLNPM